jgi:hypothetical protein
MTAFEQKPLRNPYMPASREAAAWDEGFKAASRIVGPGRKVDALDQVAKYRVEQPALRRGLSR